MQRLVAKLMEEWQKVRRRAIHDALSEGDTQLANRLASCRMFKGTETLEQLVDLMFTAQGVEFLTRYRFPSLDMFRRFGKYHPERYGLYIDKGKIALQDCKRAFLVGKTTAYVHYGKAELSRLYMMHGATAVVKAAGFSLVRLENDGTADAEVTVEDNAVILE